MFNHSYMIESMLISLSRQKYMRILASYMAIAICRYSYVFRVGGSNITGEINYPPLHCVLNANSQGDKIFQKGPNISENFVPGGPKISTKLK